jgi:succinate dehydrogenase/fumarate reductase flavoprotein subunit
MAMGIIAGREAAQRAKKMEMPEVDNAQVEELKRRALEPLERENGIRVYQIKPQFQDMMHRETGYGRTEEGLQWVLNEIERYKKNVMPQLWVSNKEKRFNFEWINALEFMNLLLAGEALVRNALMRTESRGLHDRWDYPNPDPNWVKNIHIRLVNGEWKQWTTPVEFKYWKPEEVSLGEPWSKAIQIKEYTGWRAEPLYKDI